MVFREIDDFADSIEVESIHGARIIAHGFGSKHDRHASQATGAHALVALHLLTAFIIRTDGRNEKVLHRLWSVFPVAGGIFFPGIFVGAHDNQERSIGDLGLIPSGGTNLLSHLGFEHRDKTPVLDVEGGGRQHGGFEQLTNFCIGHAMIGIIMLDRPAGLDGFEGIHGCFVDLGTLGVEFDMEVYVVVDHVFAEEGEKAT